MHLTLQLKNACYCIVVTLAQDKRILRCPSSLHHVYFDRDF